MKMGYYSPIDPPKTQPYMAINYYGKVTHFTTWVGWAYDPNPFSGELYLKNAIVIIPLIFSVLFQGY